jgi:hypothetical protein
MYKIKRNTEEIEFKMPSAFDNEDLTEEDKEDLKFEMKHLSKT